MKNEILFYKKGYRITEEGNIINPKGEDIVGGVTNGYKHFCTRLNSKPIMCRAHRLQAFQKYGEKLYEDGIVVRHLNENSLDNSFDNISIGTHKDNALDIPEAIRINRATYAASFVKRHNHDDIKKFHKENKCSYKKTMKEFNISSKGTLHYILNKE